MYIVGYYRILIKILTMTETETTKETISKVFHSLFPKSKIRVTELSGKENTYQVHRQTRGLVKLMPVAKALNESGLMGCVKSWPIQDAFQPVWPGMRRPIVAEIFEIKLGERKNMPGFYIDF